MRFRKISKITAIIFVMSFIVTTAGFGQAAFHAAGIDAYMKEMSKKDKENEKKAKENKKNNTKGGTSRGVASSTNMGGARPATGSTTVKAEGAGVTPR